MSPNDLAADAARRAMEASARQAQQQASDAARRASQQATQDAARHATEQAARNTAEFSRRFARRRAPQAPTAASGISAAPRTVGEAQFEPSGRGRKVATLLALAGVIVAVVAVVGFANAGGKANPCEDGYRERLITKTDHVCITRAMYDQVQEDNANREANRSQSDHTYGPDTCVKGKVWRDAVQPEDHVCVESATRDAHAQANAEANDHLKR